MGKLKQLYHQNLNIESKFGRRAVLAVLSESYEAPMITLIQGLHGLGFTIYTISKPNINSWFANKVIDDPRKVDFDFVLSGLHWGTRFDYYKKFGLMSRFKVLLDGCDNRGAGTWKKKYWDYCDRYAEHEFSEEVAKKRLQPFRWMMPLSGYEPDLVFTSQKTPGDAVTFYFPFGIHHEYLKMRRPGHREIDFANIPGPGPKREKLTHFLLENPLPGRIFSKSVRGKAVAPKGIAAFAKEDNNVHSYHRWALPQDYFRILNDTKVLIYPGISEKTAWWDSKRPWEAYASGCLVLYEKPTIDMSQYPVTELCKEAMYNSLDELVDKCEWLHRNQIRSERLRCEAVVGALKYFTPVPLARHFLTIVSEIM